MTAPTAGNGNREMTIPFTQYLLPDGRKRDEYIDRGPEVEEIARRFIEAGGRYECEILTTGEVSLTAVAKVNGEERDIAIVLCRNGPGVGERVDELVRESAAHQPDTGTAALQTSEKP